MESVKTALKVLEQVAETGQGGVSELARVLGEPKSTIQRNLLTLHEAGWIKPIDRHGRRGWALSTKVLSLARRLQPVAGMRGHALPIMEDLRGATRETIHLTILDGDRVVLIERLDSPQTLRTVRPLGGGGPLHATSNGKAILANLPAARRQAYLAGTLQRFTSRTLTDPEALDAQLKEIRRDGYALGDGEIDVEVRAVAAAITLESGEPVAALSISCPASRFPDDKIEAYGELVSRAAARISRAIAKDAA
jgi:DNA-binding IclR family transcriptional regulator